MIPPTHVAEIRRLCFAEHWRVGTIATQCGVHPDTVRRALATERFARPAVVRPSMVDPYRVVLQATLRQYPRLRATRLFEMVKQRGYPGSVVQLCRVVRTLRPTPTCGCTCWSGNRPRSIGGPSERSRLAAPPGGCPRS